MIFFSIIQGVPQPFREKKKIKILRYAEKLKSYLKGCSLFSHLSCDSLKGLSPVYRHRPKLSPLGRVIRYSPKCCSTKPKLYL